MQGDFCRDFENEAVAAQTMELILGGRKLDLVTLHHCLYYCDAQDWPGLIKAIYESVLAPQGAMHMVMMSAREKRPGTTTWLYNHFAGMFFGPKSDQDLLQLRTTLLGDPVMKGCRIDRETREVEFWVDDFEAFMSVIWMILLYPHGHDYSLEQRIEITEFVIEHYWRPGRPLIQTQDYVTVHKPAFATNRDPFRGYY